MRGGTSLGVTISKDDMVNFEPLVKALPRGGSVVTWTQKPVPTSGQFGTRVMAAIVGVAGGPPDFLQVLGGIRQVGANDDSSQMSAAPILDDSGGGHIAFTWVEQPEGANDLIKARVLSDMLN
jgi:hypothetical protein